MISVIIPTYNRLSSLKNTIRSLLRQSLPLTKFEVIVVDDGSSDGTEEWMRAYTGGLNLIYIRHTTNRGTARTRNDGIKAAEHDIIVFLDDDIKADKDLLSTYLTVHTKEEGVFIGNVIYEKNPKERAVLRYLSTRGVHKGREDFRSFITQNLSLKKRDAINAGLFCNSIPDFFQGEDIEFGYRLSLTGAKFIYIKDAVAFHSRTVSLNKVIKDARRFGKNILPLLVDKHPVFRDTFKLYLIEQLDVLKESPSLSLKKLGTRFFLSRVVYRIIHSFTVLFNKFFVPSLFFDYLIFYNRIMGMKDKGKMSLLICNAEF